TITGTIVAGTNSIVVSGVILATTGTGATITATQTSGDPLTAGTSAAFNVVGGADHLTFVGVPATGYISTNLASFTVEARRPDNSVDTGYTANVTIAKASGLGNLGGTVTVAAVAGIATFNAAQFDAVGSYTLTTTSGVLTPDTSGTIVVSLAPVTIAAWDFFGVLSASPPASYVATTFNTNLDNSSSLDNITRGAGANASGANNSFRTAGFQNNGISLSNTDYFQTTLKTDLGYSLNLSNIRAIYNGTATFYALPGVTSQYAYSLDGTNFTLIGSPVTSTSVLTPINVDLLGVTALQDVPSGTTVYIRYYASGQTTTGGWGYTSSASGTNGLEFSGNITCVQPVAFAVTGGGNGCATTGVVVGLANSQVGVSYQLKIGGTNTGTPVAGTGSAISFGNQLVAGTYTVEASNTNGTCNLTLAMTGSVVVTLDPASVAGTVSVNQTICENTQPTDISLTGNTGTIQWQSSPDNITFTDISGETAATLAGATIGNLTATSYYRALVTSGTCTAATSAVVIITVTPSVAASVSIAAVPSGAICSGTSVTFTATPTNGGATPTYQWKINGTDVSGETASTFTTSTLANGNVVTVVMTSNATCVIGSPATSAGITMQVSNPVGYANLQFPPSGTICQGGTYTVYGQVFQAGVTPGAGAGSGITVEFGYDAANTNPATWTNWFTAGYGSDVGNNDEYVYNFTPSLDGVYYYTFRYKSGACDWQYGGYSGSGGGFWNGTTNVNGVLTVNTNAAHTISLTSGLGTNLQSFCQNTALPTSITYAVGGGATGAGVIGLPAGMSGTYNAGVFTISGIPSAGGVFNYIVTTTGNGCATAVNQTGTLTISSTIDYANLQFPGSQTVCEGTSFTAYGQVFEPGVTPGTGVQGAGIIVEFGYDAANTNPATWTNWFAASFNSSGGGTNNDEYQYTFTAPTNGTFYYTFRYKQGTCDWQYGGYNVGGGGFWNGTTNNSGVLTVNPLATASISSNNGPICSGVDAIFTLTGTSGAVVTYNLNGGTNTTVTLTGGTAIVTVTGATANQTLNLVSVTDGICPATLTGSSTVTVNPLATASISSNNGPICSGVDAIFTLTGTSGAVVTYNLNGGTNTTVTLTGGTAIVTVTGATANQTLNLVSVTDGICPATLTGSSSVAVNPLPTASISGNNGPAVCSGSDITFTLTGTSGAVVTYNVNGGSNTTATLTGGTATVTVTGATATQTLNLVSVTDGTCPVSLSGSSTVVIESTTWDGTSWSNGTPTSTKAVSFTGNYTIGADFDACSISVSNNAVVSVTSGFNVTLNGAITVASGSSFTLNNNANLYQVNALAVNTGNIIVKRQSNPLIRLDYTMWSSPVTGQGLYSFSPFTFDNRFYVYNTSSNLYNNSSIGFTITGLNGAGVNGTDTSNVPFTTGKGYLIRLPYNHPTAPVVWNGSFTGVPNNGTKTITLANVSATQQFNAVGNPYPSPIDIDQFATDNASNIEPTLYFWRKTNNASSPSYCTWNTSSATFGDNGEAYTTSPNGVIQTGQGFFVEAKDGATSLEFNNGQRVADNANQFFRANTAATPTNEAHRVWLNLTGTGGAYSQAVVGYFTNATSGADAYDSKYFNDGPVALNMVIGSTEYVIQGRPTPFQATDIVPLNYKVTTAGTYTFAIDHFDGLFTGGAQAIYIKDNQDGSYHNLSAPYTFTSAAGTFANRFELVYQTALAVDNNDFTANSINVIKQQNDVVVRTAGTTMQEVTIYDIRGRVLVTKNNINASETKINLGTTNQVLLVQVTTTEGIKATKKVVN
ncbi:MAG: T9SS sorting signal type C domain-containing protein, partial [Flavobacterium sp.]